MNRLRAESNKINLMHSKWGPPVSTMMCNEVKNCQFLYNVKNNNNNKKEKINKLNKLKVNNISDTSEP